MTTRPLSSTRSAFTLVELMVVMTVIAILVGLLAAGVIPAMRRANEFAIQTEVTQLERAIENFKTKYGFYPPSFVGITNAYELLPYINRIAPNHAEGNGNSGTRLAEWWATVGRNISAGDGSDLVFWMSGLAKNKQYPLTGGLVSGSSWIAFDGNGDYERESFYTFNTKQLRDVVTGETPDISTITVWYSQPKGAETPFFYIDNFSYNNGSSYDGYYVYDVVNMVRIYENQNTFQIATLGMDGLGTQNSQWGEKRGATISPTIDNVDMDNITNFAQGRMERMALGTN